MKKHNGRRRPNQKKKARNGKKKWRAQQAAASGNPQTGPAGTSAEGAKMSPAAATAADKAVNAARDKAAEKAKTEETARGGIFKKVTTFLVVAGVITAGVYGAYEFGLIPEAVIDFVTNPPWENADAGTAPSTDTTPAP